MKEKLFKNMNEEDKKMLEEYLETNRKTGKSDAEIIKDATGKAGLYMLIMFVVMTLLVFFIMIIITGQDVQGPELPTFDEMKH